MLIARHADRLSRLVDHVVETLGEPLADPMQPEWIGVPSRGIATWLTQELATRVGTEPGVDGASDGIVANIEFGYPGTLGMRLLTQTAPGDEDPWSLDHTVWHLMALLEAGEGDTRLGPVGRPVTQGTRYDRARRIADLFDRYNVRRPEMIMAWANGQDTDPSGRALGPRAWQAELWRRLHARIGQPSAAQRLPSLLRQVRSGEVDLDLPPRLTMFGLSVWPQRLLLLLGALAQRREVHLLALCPSPALTSAVQGMHLGDAVPVRSEDPTTDVAAHPLIASWGRPMRETAALFALAELGAPGPELSGPRSPETKLLEVIQGQIRTNRAPAGNHEIEADDESFSVHACHGPARQVEVLHDLLLHAFEDDPTLRLDDVVVLVPDVAAFAPLIEAVFGSGVSVASGHDATDHDATGHDAAGGGRRRSLRYRITDQALKKTNPYAAAVLALLDLLRSQRFEASTVADFLTLRPVRHRFGLEDDDLGIVAEWIQATNVRWGLNSHTRQHWNVAVDALSVPNTWRSTVDQLLVGAAVADDHFDLALGEIPTVGVEGADVTLAGHLGELITRLERASLDIEHSRTFAEWRAFLFDLTMDVLAVPADDRWQRHEVDSLIETLGQRAEAAVVGDEPVLSFADVVDVLNEHLESAPARSAFRPGSLTFTSLPALRSVPRRVVCLLGFDDAAFSTPAVDGDDLSTLAPRLGDPDGRNDERQVLLEAIQSATERLIITRTGHDVVRNHEVQEAIPLSELWDVVNQTVVADAEPSARERFEFRHTRHGFDEANFWTTAPLTSLTPTGRVANLPAWPFAHDQRLLTGAERRGARLLSRARPSVVDTGSGRTARPSGARDDASSAGTAESHRVTLASLHRLLRSPVQFHVRDGLAARIPWREDPVIDTLPVDVDSLAGWHTSVGLLDARLTGVDDLSWLAAEQARGAVPAGQLAERSVVKASEGTDTFIEQVAAFGGSPGRASRPIAVQVDGRTVTGVVTGVHAGMGQVGRFEYKIAKPHHRLALWLDVAAMTLADPSVDWLGALVVREAKKAPKFEGPMRLRMAGTSSAQRVASATRALQCVMDFADHARREPLPVFSMTSYAIADDDQSIARLYDCWDADRRDDYVKLAYRDQSWADLNAVPPTAADPPIDVPQASRVAHWAHWLWGTVNATAVMVEGLPAMAETDDASRGTDAAETDDASRGTGSRR